MISITVTVQRPEWDEGVLTGLGMTVEIRQDIGRFVYGDRKKELYANGTSICSAMMPTLTLAISMSAKYMRQVRATVLEELNKDYVIGARARRVRGSVASWAAIPLSCPAACSSAWASPRPCC